MRRARLHCVRAKQQVEIMEMDNTKRNTYAVSIAPIYEEIPEIPRRIGEDADGYLLPINYSQSDESM